MRIIGFSGNIQGLLSLGVVRSFLGSGLWFNSINIPVNLKCFGKFCSLFPFGKLTCFSNHV